LATACGGNVQVSAGMVAAGASGTLALGGSVSTGGTSSTLLVAKSIAAGDGETCVVLSRGTVQCWGNNAWGGLGNDTTTDSSVPVSVTGITNAVAVAGGGSHTCVVLSGGTIQCWGYNQDGQLGNGTTNAVAPFGIPTPVTVSGITNAIAVAGGATHTCALLSGGTVQCWGANGDGELGNGTTTDSSVPVTVVGF